MLSRLAKFYFTKIKGWRLEGTFPDVDKCVVIVIPHTHWKDFTLGLVVRKMIDVRINYIGKEGLFKWPYGWFFRWMGGAPVDRSKSSNMVEAVAQLFDERQTFRLALAPEGTRKPVKKLRTGFYYMAHTAAVPIVMVAFDFGQKRVKIAPPYFTSGDWDTDLKDIRAFYSDVRGKVPEWSWPHTLE